jgi:hypothetical protein
MPPEDESLDATNERNDDTAMNTVTNGDFNSPEFWIALGIGLACLGLFITWMRTGGRRKR